MRKFILYIYTPGSDGAPVKVPVPYVTDTQLNTLLHILTKPDSLTDVEKVYLNAIHELERLSSPIDLTHFTHLVEEHRY